MRPPKLNYKWGTQKYRIWEYMRNWRSATNHELGRISGALRYGARIWEINRDLPWPWVIVTRRIRRGIHEYKLTKVRG